MTSFKVHEADKHKSQLIAGCSQDPGRAFSSTGKPVPGASAFLWIHYNLRAPFKNKRRPLPEAQSLALSRPLPKPSRCPWGITPGTDATATPHRSEGP